MEKWIRKWEDRIGEVISQNSIIVGVVLFILVVVICVLGRGKSWLLPCGGVIGGCVALYQWYSDRRVKRAELLKELLFKFNEFDIEKLLRSEVGVEQSESDEAYFDLFSFLSYVCHLYRASVLTDGEFSSLKWDIVKVLENKYVLKLLVDAYDGVRKGDRPYHDLVKVGEENCTELFARLYGQLLYFGKCTSEDVGIEEGGSAVRQNTDVCVVAGMSFPTHLSVLNGIFHLGYRAHMRGGAVVGKNKLVWFANMINKVPPVDARDAWYNDWDESKGVIHEYWPSNEGGSDPKEKVRYAFGKYLGEHGVEYRFLGVFVFEGIDESKKCRKFKLVRKEILKSDL